MRVATCVRLGVRERVNGIGPRFVVRIPNGFSGVTALMLVRLPS